MKRKTTLLFLVSIIALVIATSTAFKQTVLDKNFEVINTVLDEPAETL